MTQKKILSCIFCILLMILTGISSLPANAEEIVPPTQLDNVSDGITSVGLISDFTLTISSGTKKIYINAETDATEIMAKVGFINISIQRSANGYSGWTEETPLNDDLVQNSTFNTKVNEQHSVLGGYYYRVVLDHYAKEKGLLFPRHESITNYSNVVWVPA